MFFEVVMIPDMFNFFIRLLAKPFPMVVCFKLLCRFVHVNPCLFDHNCETKKQSCTYKTENVYYFRSVMRDLALPLIVPFYDHIIITTTTLIIAAILLNLSTTGNFIDRNFFIKTILFYH